MHRFMSREGGKNREEGDRGRRSVGGGQGGVIEWLCICRFLLHLTFLHQLTSYLSVRVFVYWQCVVCVCQVQWKYKWKKWWNAMRIKNGRLYLRMDGVHVYRHIFVRVIGFCYEYVLSLFGRCARSSPLSICPPLHLSFCALLPCPTFWRCTRDNEIEKAIAGVHRSGEKRVQIWALVRVRN